MLSLRWRFGHLVLLPPRSLLRWRSHKDLWFNWTAGLSTDVFLSIRANVRSLFSQRIPTKLTSSLASSYSTPASVSIPLQFYLGSSSTALFPFQNMYVCWRPSSSLVSRPYAVHLLPRGDSLRSPTLFCIKLFFGPFSLILNRIVPFLRVTNIIKLERLRRSASRAISGCLLSFPIPLFLSEASLPRIRATLTHFTLASYERALRLPTFFSIGLARLGVKPRLCRFSWRAFVSTHLLMLSPTSPRGVFLACSPSSSWNSLSFTVESTLSSPCSRCNPPLSRQDAGLAHFDSLPPYDLVLWTDALFLFFLAKAALAYLPTAHFVAPGPISPFQRAHKA